VLSELAFVIELVQDGGQPRGEHLLSHRAEYHLGEQEPADAGEAGVLVGEPVTARQTFFGRCGYSRVM
jgi:hypothetical protein